jgi:hypothetical protein
MLPATSATRAHNPMFESSLASYDVASISSMPIARHVI